MNAHVDIPTHTFKWHGQASRGERLCDQRADHIVCGQEQPAFIHQLGKLDLSSTSQRIVGAGDNKQPILEQDLHLHVIILEGRSDASEQEIDLALPELAKLQGGRLRCDNVHDHVGITSRQSIDDG